MSRFYGSGSGGGGDDHSASASATAGDGSMVGSLLARYGQDSSAENRNAPKPRGSTIFTMQPKMSGASGNLWWTPDSDEAAAAIPRPAVAGSAHLSQLVLHHLRSAGLGEVASVFAQELKSAGFSPEFSDVLRAPLQMGQPSLTQASALTQLLCPLAATRHQVRELLTSGAQLFPGSVEGGTHDQMTLHHLVAMFEEPMWSDVCSPTAKHRVYLRPDTGAIRAAPINTLIEQLTTTVIRPHTSDSDEQLRLLAEFRRKFFATHRHFCPSRVVLAKLMRRFMVPCSLPLALQYNAHGITIDCHAKTFKCHVDAVAHVPALGPMSASGSADAQDNAVWLDLYSQVTKNIQTKVMSLICEWLSMFPEHFDQQMEEALITFVHEACGAPAVPWSNTPVELAQAGEKIKLLLAEQNALMAAANASRNSRSGRSGTTGAEQASARKRRNIGAPNAEFDVEVASALQDASHGSFSSGSGGGGGGKNQVSVRQLMVKWDLLTLDESKLANQMTTIDHYMLRRITSAELFAQSADVGTRGHSSAAARAASSNVHAFLKRGEETMRWLLCEIIWGGSGADATGSGESDFDPDAVPATVDEQGRAYTEQIKKRVLLIKKVVSLTFRLLEMNNLHSAFACYLALRHPALLRLYDVWRNVPRDVDDNITELRELFNFDKGYRNYRDYLASMADDDLYPVVPILQVTVDELRRISSEPTVLTDSTGGPVVHWRKYDVVGTLYTRFHHLKEATVPAEFCALPPCIAWIEFKMQKTRQTDFESIVRASLKAQPSKKLK